MRTYVEKLSKNISISYLYNFFMFFGITNVIWVIYLSHRGLSLFEIGILEAIFHITCFVFEVVTGALADMYGRKFSIILGRVCAIISTILMILSQGFWGFAIAFVFSALSYTFNSGAAESLIYDSTLQIGRKEEYKKIYGTINFIIEIASAAGALVGGWLADVDFLYAYLGALVIGFVGMVAAFWFTEPDIKGDKTEKTSFKAQINDSISVLKERPLILYFMLFFAVLSTLGTTIFFYSQKYFEQMGYVYKAIAVIFTIEGLLKAASAKYAYIIEKRLTQKGVVLLLPIIYTVSVLGMGLFGAKALVGFFLLSALVGGFIYPVFSDYLNDMIPSEYRATLLSFNSALFSICMIILFPLVGLIGDKIGLAVSFIVMALLFIPATAFIIWKLNQHKNQ